MPGAILIKVRPGRVKAFGQFAGHAEHEGRVAIRFDPAKHPRDRHGHFITTGGHVRMADGAAGRVISHDGGFVEVRRDADGSVISVPARTLEVVQSPLAKAEAAHEAAQESYRAAGVDPGTIGLVHHPDAPETFATAARDRVLVGDKFLDDAAVQARGREWHGGLDIASAHGKTATAGELRHRVLVHEDAHVLARRLDENHPDGSRELDDLAHEPVTWRQMGATHGSVDADAPHPRWKIDSLGRQSAYANESKYEWRAEAIADGVLNGDQASESGKRALAILRTHMGAADAAPAPEEAAAPDHNIQPGRIYFGEPGNNGRRAYLVDSVQGSRTTTRTVLRDGQYHEEQVTKVEVTARRHYPSTGKTAAASRTVHLPPDAEEHVPEPPPAAGPEGQPDLAGLQLPRGRKLAVLHGPSNTVSTGYVENGDGELIVRRTRGGEITGYIPHDRVNVIGETAGNAGRANPVAWRRPGARAEPVLASQVSEGHTIMAPHPTGPPAPGTVIGRSDSGRTVSLTVRRADGSVDTVNLDRTYTVDRLEAGVAPEEFPDEVDTVQPEPPPPLIPALPPAGVLIARPPLYTYQRQKIVALGLDADKTQPPAVRQAAALARLRLPMTGDQAAALADAVQRAAATRKGTRPVQARALGRISYRLAATADEVRGSAPPQLPGGRAGAESTAARDLTEGDTVALAAHGADTADVVTVRGITATMGGRVITADLEHQDGTRETRTLTGRTRAWLLPDPAADKPVPPPGPHLEHILPDRLRPGDTIRDEAGAPRQVTKVEPAKSGTPLTFDVSYIGRDGDETVGRFRSADGGPAVVRTTRGPGSQDQPWDQVMPAEHPQTGILPAEIQVGDRLAVRGWQGPMTGEVQAVKTVKLRGSEPGVTVTLRLDTGYNTDVQLYDDTADRVTRLIKADDNTAARIETVRTARLERLRAAQIRGTLDDVVAEQRRVDLAALGPWMGAPADEVREAITRVPVEDQMLHLNAPGLLIRALIPDAYDSEAGGDKVEMMARERIQPVITQIAERSRSNLVQSLEAATAGLSDPAEITAARQRVADQFTDSPPPLDTGQVAQALAAAAAAMRQAAGITAGPDAAVPDLPEGADLAARVAAYKAALPDPAYIGHRQIVRAMFAQPVLADLEAGRAPAVQEVTVAVPDRAEDGGPGAIANRHLDIVMAAGRDLDAELQRRMAASVTPGRQAEHDAATARLSEVARERFQLPYDAEDAAKTAYAREHGLRGYNDVLDQMAQAHSYDDDEWERLKAIREGARAAGRAAGDAAARQREQLAAERDALKARQLTDRERADARRVAALAVLGEVRPDGLGGAQARYKSASGNADREYNDLLVAMRWGEQHYPTSWLQKYRDYTPGGYSIGTAGRGFYRDWSREVMLSKSPGAQVTGGSHYDHVAIHEEGHAMERAVPGLAALEDAYLWSRTSSGEMGSRRRTERTALGAGYEADEYAFGSDLPERYTSKTYSSSGTTIDPLYELFTTGVESLFAGSSYLDDGFRQWLLGTLATL